MGNASLMNRFRSLSQVLSSVLVASVLVVLPVESEPARATASDQESIDYSLNISSQPVSAAAQVVPSSGDFAIEFWFKLDDLSNTTGLIAQGSSSGNRFYVQAHTDRSITLYAFNPGVLTSSAGVFSTGSWNHLAILYESSPSNSKMFVNGSLVGQTTGTIQRGDTRFTLGSRFDGGLPMAGELDQLKVWGPGFTSQEQVRASMHAYSSSGVTGATLVRHYSFNEPNGSTLESSVGSGLDLALNGSPARKDVKVSALAEDDIVLTFTRTYLPDAGGWILPQNISTVSYLIVGGGGGGAGRHGGGGGAGGFLTGTMSNVAQATYSIVVGTGGPGIPQFATEAGLIASGLRAGSGGNS